MVKSFQSVSSVGEKKHREAITSVRSVGSVRKNKNTPCEAKTLREIKNNSVGDRKSERRGGVHIVSGYF